MNRSDPIDRLSKIRGFPHAVGCGCGGSCGVVGRVLEVVGTGVAWGGGGGIVAAGGVAPLAGVSAADRRVGGVSRVGGGYSTG